MWNDTVEPGGPQMTIWCNRIACWITKATNILNIYLLLFHYNNSCTNAPQCYVIRTLPVTLRSEDVSITLSHQPGGQEYLPLITETIKQFTSGTSYLMNGRLHVSVRTGPSSGLLMNQVINAAYMTVETETCSLPSIKYDVPDVNCFILVIKLLAHRDVFNQSIYLCSARLALPATRLQLA
jgi:hypothetical protein